MAVNMLAFVDRPSPIHRLSGATKFLCFIMWSLAGMLTYDTRVLLFMLVASLIIFTVSKIKVKEVSFVLLFIFLFLFLNDIAIFIFSPLEGVKIYGTKHVLFHIAGQYDVTVEQLFYELNITLKYFSIIPAALLFIKTTNPSEFASSLNRIGVSYRVAFAVAIALRYIPDIQRDFQTIAHAQQARGIDMSRKETIFKRAKNALAIVLPLIFSSLERIETISNVMDLRGFGKHKKRTWYSARPFKKSDYIALITVVALFTVSMLVTFYDGSRFYNPFV
ncbi:energy-coupling factor transporter transmembrane component T [Fictibacillus sp. Mic-4]|uniref:energy-coupling factor transporter transmembrane component T family protein n=1 Tax=Fictibacillus sp. Mic-4 TaxID=3132826 RepID=UPI003CFB1218